MAPKKSLSIPVKTAQEILAKAKTIGDEGLNELRWFTIRRIDTEGENWQFIPDFVKADEIILGFHYLHFPLPPLLHDFFALTGIHLMQINANSIVVINTLFALDFLHEKDLDLIFVAST